MGDLGPCAQQAHGLHQAQLLPPLAKGHSRGSQKKPLDRPPAGAASSRELLQRSTVGGIGQHQLGDANCSWIIREWKLQRHQADNPKLIEYHIDQVTLRGGSPLQGAARARMENQLLQQCGNIDDAAVARQRSSELRPEVQCPHRNLPRHCDGMRNPFRYPHGTVHGDYPRAIRRSYCHDSARSENQLIAIVEMTRDHLTRCVIVRQGDDLRAVARQPIEDSGLSLYRHSLTQYRKFD